MLHKLHALFLANVWHAIHFTIMSKSLKMLPNNGQNMSLWIWSGVLLLYDTNSYNKYLNKYFIRKMKNSKENITLSKSKPVSSFLLLANFSFFTSFHCWISLWFLRTFWDLFFTNFSTLHMLECKNSFSVAAIWVLEIITSNPSF